MYGLEREPNRESELGTSGPYRSGLPNGYKMATKKNSIKNLFLLFWTISLQRMSILIWLGAYFLA
jgi:hypothetical protein